MKVKLAEIKPSTPRVRKELNLDALDELAESIKETGGVIVPVKLRKNGTGYTTVYGHRRIEAAKIAGFKDIEAFIEDVDDDVLLTQALIENVVREDMAPIDIAKALGQIKEETEWTNEQMSAKFGMDRGAIGEYINMLRPVFEPLFKNDDQVSIGFRHVREAKAGTDSDEDAVKVLEKAAKEGLSRNQTRTVAEEYKRAKEWGGDKVAKQVLNTPFEELGLREFKPTTKPTRRTVTPVEPVKVTKVFSWVRDANIIRAGAQLTNMVRDIEDVRAVIEYMKVNNQREPEQLKHVVKQMKKHITMRVSEMNALLDELDEV